MQPKSRFLNILSIFVILTTILSSVHLPTASAQGRDPLKRERNAESGKVSFIGPESGRSLPFAQAMGLLPGAVTRPADPAMALAKRFAPEFGLRDAERNLTALKTNDGENGRITVKYQQNYQGIPVMGGELIVNTNQNGDLYSINGEVSPGLSLDTEPAITAEQAKQTALEAMAKWNQLETKDFLATEPELWIFDESLLQPSSRPTTLVWRMDVTSADGSLPIRELILINATTGNPDFHFNQIDTAWNVKGSTGPIQEPDPTPTTLPTETPLPIETPMPTSESDTSSSGSTDGDAVIFAGVTWYVSAATGNDSNTCTQAMPCASLQKAINQATEGDTILVASGIYTGSVGTIAIIGKGVTISGGWNSAFDSQSGETVLDGQNQSQVLYIWAATAVTLDRLTIVNGYYQPTSDDGGGGIRVDGRTTLTINNSTIRGNKARSGGGIFVSYSTTPGTITINNSTISGNEAAYYGGGIGSGASSYTASNLFINNSTIADNSAWQGGGIRIGTTPTLRNTIVARNNTQTTMPNCNSFSGFRVINSITDDPEGCITVSSSFIVADPRLSPVLFGNQNYYAIDPESPAVDAGDPTTCLVVDQRGHSRTSDTRCDIGAYEYSENGPATTLVYISGSNQKFAPGVVYEDPFSLYAADSKGAPVANVSVEFVAPSVGPGGTFDGAHTSTVSTDGVGIAKVSDFMPNSDAGTYSVAGTANGIGTITFSQLTNFAWYVSPSGSITNDCKSVASPCLTIAQAVSKAASGDTILIQSGVYQFPDRVWIAKSLVLLGGWDSGFTTQNGVSVFDGQNQRQQFYVSGSSTNTPTFVLDHISLQNGKTTYSGGALIIQNARVTIRNSSLLNNAAGSASSGGGFHSTNSIVNLQNVTMSGNMATAGGAIRFDGGKLIMNNTTIVNNTASRGGGIYSNTINAIVVRNSIIANNTASISGPDCMRDAGYGGITSLNYSLIGNTSGCSVPSGTGNLLGTSPGSMTLTPGGYYFFVGPSPAINAGETKTCMTVDQRGISRPQGTRCDMGAYERVSVAGGADAMTVVGGNNQRALPGETFSQPLSVFLSASGENAVSGANVTFTAPTDGASGTFANGSNAITVTTDANGMATTELFTSNTAQGVFSITATSGAVAPVTFNLRNVILYVSRSGQNTTDCTSALQPCYSINYAIGQSVSGDHIFVTGEAYDDTGMVADLASKSLILSGGWNQAFTIQDGQTVIKPINNRGIYVGVGRTAVFDRFDVTGGKLTYNLGGGILNSGSLTFTNGAIYQNSVHGVNQNIISTGGGIYSNGTQLILTNATISNNTADKAGGLFVISGTAKLNNVTISQNSATNIGVTALAGGILITGSADATMSNSIVAGNSAEVGQDCLGQIESAGHNLLGFDDQCQITPAAGDHIGSLDQPVNPMLGNLLENGRETFSHALLPGSPAIDGGDALTCAATDQRGVMRPQDAVCDIGAFEGIISQSVVSVVKTYNANNQHVLPGAFICDQSDPTCTAGDAVAKAVHDFAIKVDQMYKQNHGRNGIDNNSMPIISTINYCTVDQYGNTVCPYYNAFWTDGQIVYGNGFTTDDVAAHELTHGVTQYESKLFYFYQSGAISESVSDLWGEYFDQVRYVTDTDTPTSRWLIGEDISALGPLRSMSNPPAYGDPDKITSTLYDKKTVTDEDWDNGGVHTNSGVNNKAVYLMVDGGSFNGKTITALGWDKVGAVYYEAQINLLTSGSDYSDLYFVLQQACGNLIGQHGITSADCAEIKDALDSVQMNLEPVTGFNPDAPLCPTGMATGPALSVFTDDFEVDAGKWYTNGYWSLDSRYASSGSQEMWGDDAPTWYVSSLGLADGVTLPTGAFLHFKHAFAFEYYTNYFMDGGVLEYTTNGGSTWTDAKALFSAGQNYNGTIYSGYGNALKGRSAFAGDSHGYVSSRYNLATLAGKAVQFRWRFATDDSVHYRGWFLDDVQIYGCVGTPAVPILQLPANNSLTTSYMPLLNWSDPTPTPHHYQVQVDNDADFSSPVIDVNDLGGSQYQLDTPLTSNTKYYWRVKAFNAVDGTLGWSLTWNFRTALLPPVLTSPASGFVSQELRPLFDWEDVATATGYTIQISTSSTFATIAHTGNPVGSFYVPTVDLPKNATLYWRVQTKGTNGPSAWTGTPYWSLTTPVGTPPAPVLALPTSNLLLTNYRPTFSWKPVLMPSGTTLQNYIIQVDNDPNFTTPEVNATTSSLTYTPLNDLASNTKF